MNSIEISISNINKNTDIFINTKNNTIMINNISNPIDKETINNLIRIIRNWENNYDSKKSIDQETFTIKLNTDEGISVINGSGTYPENYNLFKDWISELND